MLTNGGTGRTMPKPNVERIDRNIKIALKIIIIIILVKKNKNKISG